MGNDEKEILEIRERQFKALVDGLVEITNENNNKIYEIIRNITEDLIQNPDKDNERKLILRLLRDFAQLNDKINEKTVQVLTNGAEEEVKKGVEHG